MERSSVLLIGAGHAHLHVAKTPFARMTLIDPGVFWYSGMATGMLSGQYTREDDIIDPKTLGADFVRGRVVGIDGNEVVLESGDRLPFDVVSFNVGSEVPMDLIPGSEFATPVKPISNLWDLRERLNPDSRLVVIGGGPTGVEVAANAHAKTTLLCASDRLMPTLPARMARSAARALRHVNVRTNCRVERIEPGRVIADESFEADEIVVAIGLRASKWVRELGLPLRDEALRVKPTLQSVGNERVFAGGDCVQIEGHTLPKIGVFGVRAAPVLRRNLQAFLEGRPLEEYRPQKRYLSILNLRGTALAMWGPFHWRSRWSLRLKDRIDRRWMKLYQP